MMGTEQGQELLDFQFYSKDSKKLKISGEVNKKLHADAKVRNTYCLLRYVRPNDFIRSLADHSLFLSNPSKWDDPFETKYMESIDRIKGHSEKDIKELKRYSVYAACFKIKENDKEKNEHAAWESYLHQGKDVLRLEIDMVKFCDALQNTIFEDGVLYLSMMDYNDRGTIVSSNPIGSNTKDKENVKSDNHYSDIYIKNFCLKQNAYEYEDEMRLCLIMKDHPKEDHVFLYNFDWSKVITSITFQPLYTKEKFNEDSLQKNISTLLKIKYLLGKDNNVEFFRSNLYDAEEDEMTTKITL